MKSHKKTREELQKKYDLTDWEADTVDILRRKRPTLHTILRHVSSSGMTRHIDVYLLDKERKLYLSYLVHKICGYPRTKEGALRIGGYGTDMGFAVVYAFSSRIFPEGFKYKKTEHHRNGDPAPVDKDGGYGLHQEWL